MYNNENNQGFGPFENGNNGGYPYGGQNGSGQPEVNLNGQPWQNPNRQPGAGSDVPPQYYNSQASGPYYTGQGAAGAGGYGFPPPYQGAGQPNMPYGQASGDVYDSRKNSGLAIACLVSAFSAAYFLWESRWMYWRSSWASSLSSKTIRKKGFLLQG